MRSPEDRDPSPLSVAVLIDLAMLFIVDTTPAAGTGS
jgi:hypothetical protein